MKGTIARHYPEFGISASYADIAVMPTTSCEDAAGLAGIAGMSA